jgi:hypothetical protein
MFFLISRSLPAFLALAISLCAFPGAFGENNKANMYSQVSGANQMAQGQVPNSMPAMGGGGGQGSPGMQRQDAPADGGSGQIGSERKEEPKNPSEFDNAPADAKDIQNDQQENKELGAMPSNVAHEMKGTVTAFMQGGDALRRWAMGPAGNQGPGRLVRLHDIATGGFFDDIGPFDIFNRNENGGIGTGGGGGPSGNGPGAQMYYQNHMPGHTPKRPTNPLALPGQYNFATPGVGVTPGKGGMPLPVTSNLPICCQKQLPCCKLNLRCCTQMNQNQNKNQQNKGGGGGGGGGSTMNSTPGGNPATGATMAMAGAAAGAIGLDLMNAAGGTMHQAKANASQKGGSGGGAKGEGGIEEMDDSFSMMLDYLINVANESAGSPTSAGAVSKTYANAVWMVQQMYKSVYLQIALLLILPGALLTQMKAIIGFNFLNLKDEDTLSPFVGIQRSIIAIFLIPATQLFVSYVIDTANALSGAVSQEVHINTIETWAKEQVQTFESNQLGKMFEDMPVVPRAPYRGKAASMPKQLAVLEWMSYCDIAMCEAINQCVMVLSVAAIIFNVFQLVFMCYLYLMGPITAAFFAWPGVGRELFRKSFSSWMDGVVILALWKFWWDIVLLCWGVWIENGHGNPYELVNGYYCIAWLSLLLFVPFNPFDFKVGEIVQNVLSKAEGAAAAGAKKGAQQAQKKGGGGGPG